VRRYLAVCCDGTWNTPDQAQDGVPTPTNVVRLHHALVEDDRQLRYYHPGVGTGPGLGDRLAGGGLGVGLSANIKSAYSWLATNYRDGDAICLFGFSRGAYTVRSLTGMLAACGLWPIPASTLPSDRWKEIDRLYDEVYRPAGGRTENEGPPYEPPPIEFLGVWDTVGALGIPKQLGLLTLLDVDNRHEFHNTALSDEVKYARHAVAIDEHRAPFTPTLWTRLEARPPDTTKQVWFPGDHCDVGGGYPQTGLSDGTLDWMISEAEQCTELRFRSATNGQIKPNPRDVLHDSCTGFYCYLSPTPRPTPAILEENSEGEDAAVAKQTLRRHNNPPLTVGEYWTTRILQPDESATAEVYASRPWNYTRLYLIPGRYQFEASGEWLNGSTPSGPAGTRPISFHPSRLFELAGSFTGWWQEHFRHWTHDQAATFFGAPRLATAHWMSLLGTVASQQFDLKDGALKPYKPFTIGTETEHEVDTPGYLYAYANDAWGFYDHNRGSVRLTVTRL
jgi:Uncharacterized alpha/beta hydrolase domain (DUF2235)